jgi:hypothetical protein
MNFLNVFHCITYKAGWCFRIPEDIGRREGGKVLERIRDEFLEHEVRFAGVPKPGDEIYFVRRDDSTLTVEDALEIFRRHGVEGKYVRGKQVKWTVAGLGKPKHKWL